MKARPGRLFRFRLALALGMTVAELNRRISSKELTEWQAYFTLGEFGERDQDYRFGLLASIFANAHRDRKRRPKPFEPADFFPNLRIPEQEKHDRLAAKIKASLSAFNRRRQSASDGARGPGQGDRPAKKRPAQ